VTLTEDLKQACLRRLRRDWGLFNWQHLGSKLRPPTLELDAALARVGAWDRATRRISISEAHVLGAPWEIVLDTLKHEMAHQYVDEVLGFELALPHGEAFRRACKLLGVDHAATVQTGAPGVSHAGGATDEESVARLRKIRRLLALAQSSNVHEAEAALAKANELLLKYNIDLAAAQTERTYCHRHLGRPTGRRPRYALLLAGLLTEHFFVEAIWLSSFDAKTGKSGYVLEICGTPDNVDLAEYAWHELLRSGHELWRKHRSENALDSDRDRRAYIEGVFSGFGEKLREQRRRHEQRNELIWLGDPGLDAFFRVRHPRVRNESFALKSYVDAFDAGKEAGASLRLTRAVKSAHAEDAGRLLPGGG
jgi:hypothetical protein